VQLQIKNTSVVAHKNRITHPIKKNLLIPETYWPLQRKTIQIVALLNRPGRK